MEPSYSSATRKFADAYEQNKAARDVVTIKGLKDNGITKDMWDSMTDAQKKTAVEALHPRTPGKKGYVWRNDADRNADISNQLGAQ